MSTVLFDTQIALDALKASGVPEEQARGHVRVLHDALDQGAATKADMRELRAETNELRTALQADMARVDGKITALDAKMTALQWRMTALVIEANGVLGLLLKFGG